MSWSIEFTDDPIENDPIFVEVHRLIQLEVMAERESFEEAPEKGASARFAEYENAAAAFLHLQEKDPGTLAASYIALMKRYIELEMREDG